LRRLQSAGHRPNLNYYLVSLSRGWCQLMHQTQTGRRLKSWSVLLIMILLKKVHKWKNNKITHLLNFYLFYFFFFLIRLPGVIFTNILWAAFALKSFCQKITIPNCKHLKAVQRTLVWLSISPIFYKQLFHTKVLWALFMCLQNWHLVSWEWLGC